LQNKLIFIFEHFLLDFSACSKHCCVHNSKPESFFENCSVLAAPCTCTVENFENSQLGLLSCAQCSPTVAVSKVLLK